MNLLEQPQLQTSHPPHPLRPAPFIDFTTVGRTHQLHPSRLVVSIETPWIRGLGQLLAHASHLGNPVRHPEALAEGALQTA